MKAANVPVEPYWPLLFAKLVEKRSIEDLITNVGSGGGGGAVAVAAPTAGGGGGAAAPPPVEEKKVIHWVLLFEIWRALDFFWFLGWFLISLIDLCIFLMQEEPKEESDDDMGFSLFD